MKLKLTVFICAILLTGWIMLPPCLAQDGNNNFRLMYSDPPDDMIIDSNTREVISGSDLDQDGYYEVIVTDYSMGGQAHVFEFIGDDNLVWVWSSPGTGSQSGFPARSVATGDLDGDGFGEILLSIARGDRLGQGETPPDEAGLHVFEWDGVNDNGYGITPTAIITIDPSLTGPL